MTPGPEAADLPRLGYDGPLTVSADGESAGVTVNGHLRGVFQPIDGSFHWYGRLDPDDAVTDLAARLGRRPVHVAVSGRNRVRARIGEQNPWGGRRIIGTGPPPFAVAQDWRS
ncbi:MAG: DUF4873 domain-containing protein [Nocardioidaceae bacterium]